MQAYLLPWSQRDIEKFSVVFYQNVWLAFQWICFVWVQVGNGSRLMANSHLTQLQMLKCIFSLFLCRQQPFTLQKWLPLSSWFDPDHKMFMYCCIPIKHAVLYQNKISCCFGEILLNKILSQREDFEGAVSSSINGTGDIQNTATADARLVPIGFSAW